MDALHEKWDFLGEVSYQDPGFIWLQLVNRPSHLPLLILIVVLFICLFTAPTWWTVQALVIFTELSGVAVK